MGNWKTLPSSMDYADRLRKSSNPIERRSLLLGTTVDTECPVLLDRNLLPEHGLMIGAPGSAKTSLGLMPLMMQLIRGDDGTVIVLDLKGDDALFHTAELEAERTGREFKWFTNRTGYSSYVFNPFAQPYLNTLSLRDVTGFFVSMLNLFHGADYGRAYFSIMARTLLMEALSWSQTGESDYQKSGQRKDLGPIKSFSDLYEYITRITESSDRFRPAEHLAFVIKNLAGMPQLNFCSSNDNQDTAVDNEIRMSDAVAEKQVLYFYLSAVNDAYTLSEIARMVVYSAIQAADSHRIATGAVPAIYLLCDEAQHLIANNIRNVLAQARSFGLGCIFAMQSLSQLNQPGGVDLRELMLNCTVFKQFWATRDPFERDYISKISGEVAYVSASWDQRRHTVLGGLFGREFVAARGDDQDRLVSISEQVGPRLTAQDIDNFGRLSNVSITAIQRNSGFSCYDGAFPVRTEWAMPESEYKRRSLKMAWPEKTNATVVVDPEWDFERKLIEYQVKATEVEKEAGMQRLDSLFG